MQRKVAWLFVWTTLTYWLGCGENQNYRINQEDEPPLRAVEPAQSQASPVEPSLRGADRSHWQRTAVGAADGRVPHFPYYFKRPFFGGAWSLQEDRPSPLYFHAPDIEPSLVAGLEDDRDRYTVGKFGDVAMSSGKFAMDMLSTPVRAVTTEPFWKIQHSPQEQSPKP
jgi:hypothetical protein